ncbi:hypothetical protein AV545_03740 [Paenibacillus jamilae]|uniref:hypothetical protein n=1 Tax=Paenibacillus jamilae TaxID=114136 RepID=UPI0007ABB104|nr:hypothetical protein [Paenibacillus jamilae]KZE65044.1 hypothetical protein AV545_03740 [Paenibacillus jamilae]
MNEYFVYTEQPQLLENYGEIYYPKIKVNFVGFKTDLNQEEVRNIEGVQEVRVSDNFGTLLV